MSNCNLNQPVGTVLCIAETAMGGRIGIAHVDANLAPTGTKLYVQPKDSRLNLEVEVANDNALHWQQGLRDANARNRIVRDRHRTGLFLLGKCVGEGFLSDELKAEILNFVEVCNDGN